MTIDEAFKYGLGWFATLGVCLAFGLWCYNDTRGLDTADHRGPVPADVVRLSGTSFVFLDEDRDPGAFCRDSTNGVGDGIEAVKRPRGLDGTYVQCEAEQHFNREGDYINSAEAFDQLFSWRTAIAFGMLALFCFGWGVILIVAEVAGALTQRRRNKKQRKQEIVGLEQRRRELVKAYAADEIDHVQFNGAMDKLYAQGPPKA